MARDTHIYGHIDSTRGDGRAIIPKVKCVRATSQTFAKVVEVPARARNVRAYRDAGELPSEYRHAMQDVR